MKRYLLTALFLFAVNAWAQPYIALGVGRADVKLSGMSDKESVAMPAIGFRFSDYFAIEASYLRINDFFSITGSTATTWSAKGAGLAAIGTLPLGSGFSLLGKAGFYSLDSERGTSTIPGGPVSTTKRNIGERPAFGLGAAYSVTQNLQIRAMLEQVDGKDDLDRIRILNIGAAIFF